MATVSDDLSAIARRYERFATTEARGSSPTYERLALGVAGSSEILAFLNSLPADCRQPNLFFGAVRALVEVPRDGRELEASVREQPFA